MSVCEKILLGDTSQVIFFLMKSSSDHITPTAGLTVSVKISTGAAHVSGAGTVTEVGGGEYSYRFGLADIATEGRISFKATATSADEYEESFDVVGDSNALSENTEGLPIPTDLTSLFGGHNTYGDRNIFQSTGK